MIHMLTTECYSIQTLVLTLLRASHCERSCSSSASPLVLFLAASAVRRQKRSSSAPDSSLEHIVDACQGHLTLRLSEGKCRAFSSGIMKQLFSEIYRTHLNSSTHSTPSKSSEMLHNCRETAFMATREAIRPSVPERIHECVESSHVGFARTKLYCDNALYSR